MSNKEHFETMCKRFEQNGLLPKGKTADLLENYDFVIAEIDKETKLIADERTTIPEVDHEALDEQTKKRARKA